MNCEVFCVQDQTPLKVDPTFRYKGSIASLAYPGNAVWLTKADVENVRDTLNEILKAEEEREEEERKGLLPIKLRTFNHLSSGSGIDAKIEHQGVRICSFNGIYKGSYYLDFEQLECLIKSLSCYRDHIKQEIEK